MSKLTEPTPQGTVKPGVFSTEFYLALAANAIAVLNADKVWTFLSPHDSAIVMTLVTSAYALSRGWAKSAGK